MKGGPTSASTGSPLARPTFIPGTPRFVWFIALLGGTGLLRPFPGRERERPDRGDDATSPSPVVSVQIEQDL